MKRSVVYPIVPLGLVFFIIAFSSGAFAEESRIDRVEKEVIELKKENEALKKRLDDVEVEQEDTRQGFSTLARLVDVSGYADAEYNLTSQPGENSKFRIRHLSLFFSKDVEKEWKLFSEVEYEDAPLIESNPKSDTTSKSQGNVFVEQMYIQYHPKVDMDFRFGRFLTPAGIWSIYRYPPYVPTQSYPMFYKVVFPEVSDGIQVRKSLPIAKDVLDTHLFVSNGGGNPGSGDRNENKAVGARFNYAFDDVRGLEVGATLYRDKDNLDVMHNAGGVHLQYTKADLRFQGEYVHRRNHPANDQGIYSDRGAYGQLSYSFGKWTIAGRLDWYNYDNTRPQADHLRYTGALNYHFAHNVVGKAEINKNTYDDPRTKNYTELIFSIVVAIGDL